MTRKTTEELPSVSDAPAISIADAIPSAVALVLQGGGALGAYQAGVYHAMHDHDLTPDWVVGTSIGAINAAIIAGNKRELRLSRLKEFWNAVAHGDLVDLSKVPDSVRQANTWWTTTDIMARGVPGFFTPRPMNPFAMGWPVPSEQASFYDTRPLAETLERLVDFDYLNAPEGIRLTVSAVKVTCGDLVHFDSKRQRIGIEHIMASGALPPGFAPVRVDGELYWDGGLYSNTPLEVVLDDEPRVDRVCVMVDLWSANGNEPTTLGEVQTRHKDIMYASRSRRHIANYQRLHQLRRKAQALYETLPEKLRSQVDTKDLLDNNSTVHVVRLCYGGHDWNMTSKDINFSRGSVEWRWEQGYEDALRASEGVKATDLGQSDAGLVVHEPVTSSLTR